MNPVRLAKRTINRIRGEAMVSGIVLPIDRSILSPQMELTLAAGRYERRERKLASRVVRDGDVVLELGAGLGFISSYLRKSTGVGKIVAVEANPRLIPYIQRVHAMNASTNIEVLNGVVVPDHAGPASFSFYCRRDFWASSLSDTSPYEAELQVKTHVLPDLLTTYRPDVLVMDIEGGEIELLSAKDLGSIRAAVIETHPYAYGAAGLAALESNLQRLGFHEDETGTAPMASCEPSSGTDVPHAHHQAKPVAFNANVTS